MHSLHLYSLEEFVWMSSFVSSHNLYVKLTPSISEKKWKVKFAQSCPTLCDPMDYTVHGVLQARILEWVAFSWGSSQSRDWTQVSHIAGGFFTSWVTREAQYLRRWLYLDKWFLIEFKWGHQGVPSPGAWSLWDEGIQTQKETEGMYVHRGKNMCKHSKLRRGASEWNQLCQHINLGLQASRNVRKWISVV